MEVWEIISILCKTVVKEQNVYLSITVNEYGLSIQLIPTESDDIIGEGEDE